jgi:hypothetical protein
LRNIASTPQFVRKRRAVTLDLPQIIAKTPVLEGKGWRRFIFISSWGGYMAAPKVRGFCSPC